MRFAIFRATCLACLTCFGAAYAGASQALVISGNVTDGSGNAIPHVRVTITAPAMVPATVSIFSDVDGSFESPDVSAEFSTVQVSAFRIGWQEVQRTMQVDESGARYQLMLQSINNVAHQVPSSAWIPGEPGERR